MKKIAITFCAFFIILILSLYAINKTSDSVIKKDKKYIKDLLNKNIRLGMTPDKINAYFKDHDRQLSLWDCPETSLKGNDCIGERALVITIPLPSNFFWLGKGDAQIYFYINSENILENFDYELYYQRFH